MNPAGVTTIITKFLRLKFTKNGLSLFSYNYFRMNVVILDNDAARTEDRGWNPLRQLANVTVYGQTQDTEEKIERAMEADIILTNKVLMDRQTLNRLPRLKYIGVLATGYNVVDIEAAKERGITVTNVPVYSTESVAQHTLALLLAVTNRVEHYADATRQGVWSAQPVFCYWDTNLMELHGKTFGIFGFGNIGSRVAELAHVLGMKVAVCTSKSQEQLLQYVTKVTKEELFAASDVLSLHCPLTDSTRHMINASTIAQMKPTAIIINTGRGPLVDEEAMAQALQASQLAAYCADVMETEPPSKDSPLLQQPNAFLTPHIAWATPEARQRVVDIATENIRAFLDGEPKNVVG